jgi:hypothetical protein
MFTATLEYLLRAMTVINPVNSYHFLLHSFVRGGASFIKWHWKMAALWFVPRVVWYKFTDGDHRPCDGSSKHL